MSTEKQPLVLCITGTLSKNTDRKELFNLPSYNTIISAERKERGSNVAIYVKCNEKASFLGELRKTLYKLSLYFSNIKFPKLLQTAFTSPNLI